LPPHHRENSMLAAPLISNDMIYTRSTYLSSSTVHRYSCISHGSLLGYIPLGVSPIFIRELLNTPVESGNLTINPNSVLSTTSDKFMKYLAQFIPLLFLIVQLLFFNPVHAKSIHPAFKKLVKRLQVDGMDEKYLRLLFTRPELELMPKAVAKSLTRREASLNYAQFLEKDSVDRAISYLKTHNRILEKMERHFGVSAPVVVAILSVETACGKHTGRFNTINILVTQTLSLEPEIYQQICDQIPLKGKLNLTPGEIKKKLMKKSTRAYKELKALLAYTKNQNIDPFIINGSIEGAIGLPQFLPSNIKRYGCDGNGDDEVNLFQHEDAIASIASYLKAHNWREDNDYKKKKKIILKYNYSNYYASTVLELAERIKHHWH
jgi:membrane-bound lytic murein transglycosylase B